VENIERDAKIGLDQIVNQNYRNGLNHRNGLIQAIAVISVYNLIQSNFSIPLYVLHLFAGLELNQNGTSPDLRDKANV
jgi:hypothetical protein